MDAGSQSQDGEGFVEIILRDNQISACKGLLKAVKNFGVNYNSTPTGGGKTPMTLWQIQQLAIKQDTNVLIVGPSSLNIANKTSPWKRETERYEMVVDKYYNYEGIRGGFPKIIKGVKPPAVVCTYYGDMPKVEGQKRARGYDDIKKLFTWVDEDEKESYKLIGDDKSKMHYSSTTGAIMRKDIRQERHIENPKTGKTEIEYYYETEYSPTMELMQYFIDHNVCLIIEEIQSTKNPTSTNNATSAIIRAARRAWSYKEDKGAYIFCISASPIDSKSNALNFFRLIGHVDPVHTGSFNGMFVTSDPWKLDEAYEQSAVFAPGRAKDIKNSPLSKDKKNPAAKNQLAMMYLLSCVMYRIHFASLNITPKQIWNAFLDIEREKDKKYLRKAHRKLKEIAHFQQEGKKDKVFRALTKAHGLMEKAIACPIAADVIRRLNEDKKCKCIIAFDRIESVDICINYLAEHGYNNVVARIAGDNKKDSDISDSDDDTKKKGVTGKEKQATIEKFQADTDEIRVIVAITARISIGIDLHDKFGGRRRWTYTPGNYNRLRSEQIYGRTPRIGSKSIPQILVCYPKSLGSLIMKVYKSYQEKSEVLASLLGSRISKHATPEEIMIHNALVKTPDQYDVYIQLSCPELSYYQGSQAYDYITKELTPTNPDKYFYVGTNDEEGKKNFSNIKFMVNYLSGQCELPKKKRQIEGIIFESPVPSSVDPFANSTDIVS
jgi:hypothetical protein